MKLGEIYKYLPTSTVGKVTEMRTVDGKEWALLDFTGLWYDASTLTKADASEYKEFSYKYKERTFKVDSRTIEDLSKEAEEVDISEFTPSGGG